jgi:hypothetical protein
MTFKIKEENEVLLYTVNILLLTLSYFVVKTRIDEVKEYSNMIEMFFRWKTVLQHIEPSKFSGYYKNHCVRQSTPLHSPTAYIYFLWFLQGTVTISLYSIHQLVLLMEALFSVRYELNLDTCY